MIDVDLAPPRLGHLDVARPHQAAFLIAIGEVERRQLARRRGADLRDDLRVAKLVILGDQRDVAVDLLGVRVVDDEVLGLDAAGQLVLEVARVDRVAEVTARVMQRERAGEHRDRDDRGGQARAAPRDAIARAVDQRGDRGEQRDDPRELLEPRPRERRDQLHVLVV